MEVTGWIIEYCNRISCGCPTVFTNFAGANTSYKEDYLTCRVMKTMMSFQYLR